MASFEYETRISSTINETDKNERRREEKNGNGKKEGGEGRRRNGPKLEGDGPVEQLSKLGRATPDYYPLARARARVGDESMENS